jgi:hypothetical protein
MRGFLWVCGGFGAAIVLAFAFAMLRGAPDPHVVLPPAVTAGAELRDAAADDAFRAWSAALPPAPLPLTTRYELRVEIRNGDAHPARSEWDLRLVNGHLGSLRMDLHGRSTADASALRTVVDGAIVLEGDTFWAWGSLPINEEFERHARGKVVRLPQELLSAFFAEGLRWFDGLGVPLPQGADGSAPPNVAEWFHPARVAAVLARGATVTALSLEGDTLRVTATGASAVLALLARMGGGEPEFAAAASTPLELAFDADTGELRTVAMTLPEERGFFRIVAVDRVEEAAPADFRYPEGLQVFDLAPLSQMGLGMLRKARPERSDEEF